MKIGIVSGYFNPLHYGHIEYINEAKKHSEKLICIINNDHQVTIKGSKPFMDADHRAKILHNLKSVDEVFISIDTDKTVRNSIVALRNTHPGADLAFFNSGDRKGPNVDLSESDICREHSIEVVILDLPKLYSSSTLLENI